MTANPISVQCDEHSTVKPIGVPCSAGGVCCAHRHARAALAVIQQRAGKAPLPYRGKWRDLTAEDRTAAIDPGAVPCPVLTEEDS